MTNLFRKVFVLILLSALVVSVYLIRNEEARVDFFAKLGMASSGDFKIPDTIKISEQDIYIGEEEEEGEKTAFEEKDEEPVFEEKEDSSSKEESEISLPGTGSGSPEAWLDEGETLVPQRKVTLEEIEAQIVQISREIENLQESVKIMIAMNEVQKEIKDLADQAEELDVECEGCNILSSL
jgi:hypothetical protein